jgi:hypothetical protein
MLTRKNLERIIADIRYKDWTFRLGGSGDDMYLQVVFNAYDVTTGKEELQKCRKWRLSKFMIPAEVVRTAWLAVAQAEMHEAAENFLYRKQAVHNPHLDYDALVEWMAEENRIVSRPEQMTLSQI